MTEKEKCLELKKIRKEMADKLGIDLKQKECTYEGNCKGTCPKCKQEELMLNTAILKKKALIGSVGLLTSLTLVGCTNGIPTDVEGLVENNYSKNNSQIETVVLSGDVVIDENYLEEKNNSKLEKNEGIDIPVLMGDIAFDENYLKENKDCETKSEKDSIN